LQLFDQQYLMDVLAHQSIGRGDEDHVKLGHRRRVAQGVESGAVQARAAVTVAEVDVLCLKRPTLSLCVRL
jgi:hypothetical protein